MKAYIPLIISVIVVMMVPILLLYLIGVQATKRIEKETVTAKAIITQFWQRDGRALDQKTIDTLAYRVAIATHKVEKDLKIADSIIINLESLADSVRNIVTYDDKTNFVQKRQATIEEQINSLEKLTHFGMPWRIWCEPRVKTNIALLKRFFKPTESNIINRLFSYKQPDFL